jgi:hypothetical protein
LSCSTDTEIKDGIPSLGFELYSPRGPAAIRNRMNRGRDGRSINVKPAAAVATLPAIAFSRRAPCGDIGPEFSRPQRKEEGGKCQWQFRGNLSASNRPFLPKHGKPVNGRTSGKPLIQGRILLV